LPALALLVMPPWGRRRVASAEREAGGPAPQGPKRSTVRRVN